MKTVTTIAQQIPGAPIRRDRSGPTALFECRWKLASDIRSLMAFRRALLIQGNGNMTDPGQTRCTIGNRWREGASHTVDRYETARERAGRRRSIHGNSRRGALSPSAVGS